MSEGLLVLGTESAVLHAFAGSLGAGRGSADRGAGQASRAITVETPAVHEKGADARTPICTTSWA